MTKGLVRKCEWHAETISMAFHLPTVPTHTSFFPSIRIISFVIFFWYPFIVRRDWLFLCATIN